MQVVFEAGDGRQALEHVAAIKSDVVVLDLTLPKMSGLSNMKALMRRGRTILQVRFIVAS